jgi:hypothetical protein
MVCGWDKGYFGMQELGNGKKLLIFSVWDSNQNDRNKVPEEKRTKLLYKDEKIRIGRFGGEGTGGQSFFDYDWKVGETYRFLLSSTDVQHGFSMQPDNVNLQVVPGYVTAITLTPKASGTYHIVCNEYCGPGHHIMLGRIEVTP